MTDRICQACGYSKLHPMHFLTHYGSQMPDFLTLPDKSREGLNALLGAHPTAKVVKVIHQELTAHHTTARVALMVVTDNPGPWSVITLHEDDQYLEFAMWNVTGNVYAVDENGAAADNPCITVTEL